MVVRKAEEARVADRRLRALADPTRRDILRRTLQAEHSVSALARLYPMSFAAVQKHVAVLQEARLVTKRADGREQMVRGDIGAVTEVRALLEEFETLWRDRIDRFAEVLGDQIREEDRR